MNDGVKLLRYRPATVQAMKVERENLAYVATWSGGVLAEAIGVWVVTAAGAPNVAKIGDWIVRLPDGSFVAVADSSAFTLFEAIV